MASPLKAGMNYSKGTAPKGVSGVSMGKDGWDSSTAPKIMKGARPAGAMYKSPGNLTLRGKNATDKSSGQSNPTKGSSRDKEKYNQARQPAQYSNLDNGGLKPTKFVC